LWCIHVFDIGRSIYKLCGVPSEVAGEHGDLYLLIIPAGGTDADEIVELVIDEERGTAVVHTSEKMKRRMAQLVAVTSGTISAI
jgi:hypothetical protein